MNDHLKWRIRYIFMIRLFDKKLSRIFVKTFRFLGQLIFEFIDNYEEDNKSSYAEYSAIC